MAIDFEASCLPRHGRSFPIEVGIAGGGIARSWIIRPHAAWTGWDWTAEAEALHGLSRARIEAEGEPADLVLAQLAAAVAGCRVVADEPRIAAAMAHADALHPARHRAVADALWLSGLIEALSGAARPLQASPVIARVA